MDREIDQTKQDLLVELSNGLLVFTSDYLIKHIPELNWLVPEQVAVENEAGVLRDFGHGAYLFVPSKHFDGVVELCCVIAGVPITVSCELVPLQTAGRLKIHETPILDTFSSDIGCFSILADNSLLITHKQLWALLELTPLQANSYKIQSISAEGGEYQAELLNQLCLLYRHQPVYSNQRSPLPKSVSLQIQLINQISGECYQQKCTLDLCLFHHLFVTPLTESLNVLPCYLRQMDLLRSASELSSPILFIDSVTNLESNEPLSTQENGSFTLSNGDVYLMYSISDAIDIIALGIAIPLHISNQQSNQGLLENKWCDIEVNKQDLLSRIELDNPERLNGVCYQYCDWVKVVTESEEALRLRSHGVNGGVGTLSLSASEGRAAEGFISFELLFMPNLVFEHCVRERGEHQWQVSAKEIEKLVAKRTKKRIQQLDINCSTACVTMSDTDTCTLWITQWCDKVRLNLTLTFEDGSLGFSSINI